MFLYINPWNAISLNLEHRNVDMVSCSPIIVSVPDGNQRNSSLLPQIGLKRTILKFKVWSWSDKKGIFFYSNLVEFFNFCLPFVKLWRFFQFLDNILDRMGFSFAWHVDHSELKRIHFKFMRKMLHNILDCSVSLVLEMRVFTF